MMNEFYISYDGIRLHAKLDKPETPGRDNWPVLSMTLTIFRKRSRFGAAI